MKATKLIVQCLEIEGMEYIFDVPDEENIDLLDALLGSFIRFVMAKRMCIEGLRGNQHYEGEEKRVRVDI